MPQPVPVAKPAEWFEQFWRDHPPEWRDGRCYWAGLVLGEACPTGVKWIAFVEGLCHGVFSTEALARAAVERAVYEAIVASGVMTAVRNAALDMAAQFVSDSLMDGTGVLTRLIRAMKTQGSGT